MRHRNRIDLCAGNRVLYANRQKIDTDPETMGSNDELHQNKDDEHTEIYGMNPLQNVGYSMK